MKIGLVGATYQQSSLPYDAQRTINLYPVLDQGGKEVGALYGTPGLKLFATTSSGSMRQMFYSTSGRAFAVCGSQFLEIISDGSSVIRGTLLQSSGTVYIEENGTQIAVCDTTNLYIFKLADNSFEQIIGNLNYVTNGTFASDTGWTKGSGWTISGGAANASTASTALSQNAGITLVSGATYTVTFTITRSAGSVTVSLGGGTAGAAVSAAQTITQTLTAGSTQVIAFTGSGFTGTITDVSVNDVAFGLPSVCSSLTYIDSYFIVSEGATGHFYKSAPNDGTSWDALDFATAESSPDNLDRVIAAVGQLWLLGDDTTEIWTDTGASSFPFQKISGGKMTMGILAPASAIEMDNTLFWVGKNQSGDGMVFRATGFIPRRISTEPIERILQQATDSSNITAYTYQQNGHIFYVLTGGGLPTTLVYDVTTDMWHERAYLNSQAQWEQHLGACYMRAFGKHLVGDRRNGNIYELDENTYDDNGDALSSVRIFPHISQEDKRIRYNRLSIGLESGVGNQSGLGVTPQIELRISRDGARTWSDWVQAPMGSVGEYHNTAVFRRLGVGQQITFMLRITDPVKRVLYGAYLL